MLSQSRDGDYVVSRYLVKHNSGMSADFMVYYPMNVSKMTPAFSGNAAQLSSLKTFMGTLAADSMMHVKSVTVTGYSSPDGVEAEIELPGEAPLTVTGGEYTFERESEELFSEPYTPESTVLEVFDNPKAVRAFNEVFGGIFTGHEIAWMKNEPKTLQFMAEFRDMEKKMKLSDFPAMLARANEIFKRP